MRQYVRHSVETMLISLTTLWHGWYCVTEESLDGNRNVIRLYQPFDYLLNRCYVDAGSRSHRLSPRLESGHLKVLTIHSHRAAYWLPIGYRWLQLG